MIPTHPPPPGSTVVPPERTPDGPISEIDQLIEYYHCAKFGAFIKNRTIISPYCWTTIPVEERTCLQCFRWKENCVEHKQHFLMYCQGYATIRDELYSHISNIDAIYTNLSDNERTKYLLRADNKDTSK